MKWAPDIWAQLKNKTVDEIISALEKDGYVRDTEVRKKIVYRHPHKSRIVIHYHPGKTYGPGLLKKLLEDIAWTEEDMRRLKLIK